MDIRIYEELARAIGEKELQRFSDDVDFEKFTWQRFIELDVVRLAQEEVESLLELIKPHALPRAAKRGAQVLVKDLQAWLKALDDPDAVRARTNQHFSSLVTEVLLRVPGHRIYRRSADRDVWFCYYASEVEFHAKQPGDRQRDARPAHTDLELVYVEFGGRDRQSVVFYDGDCLGIPVVEALGRKGFVVETPELREQYLEELKRYHATVSLIGHQYWATGAATDNVDGNGTDHDRWSRYSKQTITLDRDGEPGRVLLDLFYEEKEEKDHDDHFEKWFWRRHEIRQAKRAQEANKAKKQKAKSSFRRKPEDDEMDEQELEDVYDKEPQPEIPVHPMLAVFDLRRHIRVRIHLSQLTEYQYDSSLGDKLILPDEQLKLVDMLLSHKGQFQDIVKGKGLGASILCAGPPGTGKTLTAEVYSETSARPLYSVQCSQLGLSPEYLEKQLLKAFARAQRWNAILLLDEADVYVAERGTDLEQNAIVGVFLRVLEYYKGVLFLTTNRGDLVDDAIASRCVARIPFAAPGPKNQTRIWEVLAAAAGIKLAKGAVQRMVELHPALTGRDVKNLLKLAQMSTKPKQEVSAETLAFVYRFKPTETKGTTA